jgi:hypothetical protein
VHRPVADGERVSGIYRRSVMLASGRYAMLDDGWGSAWCRGSRSSTSNWDGVWRQWYAGWGFLGVGDASVAFPSAKELHNFDLLDPSIIY